MHNVVSVDGFIADKNDDVGPLHDWYFNGGLVDEVAMDVVPVVFGSGKRYFGSIEGQHLLEDPTWSSPASECYT
jgi:dihydrofolate reductase